MRTAKAPTAWEWPVPPLINRYNTTVTEIFDDAADGQRVAVIEGSMWPPVGTEISVQEDADHVRRGTVTKVEVVLTHRAPARVMIRARLEQGPV
jgi:hypothetical protein